MKLKTKDVILYEVRKYSVAAVICVPLSVVTGSISVPLAMQVCKSQAGKVVSGLIASVGSGLMSATIAEKIADMHMDLMNPAMYRAIKQDEYEVDASIHDIM